VLPLVAASALQLAMTQGASPDSPAPSAAALAEACGVEPQALLDMCWRLQQLLHDDTLAISATRCLKVYLERIGYRCALISSWHLAATYMCVACPGAAVGTKRTCLQLVSLCVPVAQQSSCPHSLMLGGCIARPL
jgi:hypothetical protein